MDPTPDLDIEVRTDMDPKRDLDIEVEDRQRAGTGYPIRQNRDGAELLGPEGEVAAPFRGSVGKVRRELERLGQPLSRTERALKRAFDLVGGAMLLIVLAPVWLSICLLIKMDSPGPILFRQRRIGQYGVPFRMFKFRTMVEGADTRKPALLHMNEAAEGLFKISGDPRLTRTGRWLRRTSLDELPQLLDVISGRMSLVGPRPLIPQEDSQITGAHRSRLSMRPGMTGVWQVNGASAIPISEMVELDSEYIKQWSLWLDVKLLLLTASHVVHRRGW
jgi:lipopolysaccharide/colanic/teichoic acid biosynthesis glycosyltransferase